MDEIEQLRRELEREKRRREDAEARARDEKRRREQAELRTTEAQQDTAAALAALQQEREEHARVQLGINHTI